jgi:hypothetical protein
MGREEAYRNAGEPFKVLVLRGSFLSFLAILDRVGSISSIFGSHFSLFCRFSNFVIRYTRTAEGMLMYCSSENTFKAGQLGP